MFRTLMLGGSLLRLTPAFFDTDSNGDGNNSPNPDDKKGDENKWTPEQQAEINRIAAQERRDAEEKARQKFESEQAAKEQKAKEDREREEATKRGEFDKVRTELEGKLNQAEEKFKTAEADNKFLRGFVDKTLEREIAELPEVVKAFDPGPEATIQARLDWLEKAREQADKFGDDGDGEAKPAGSRPPKKPAGVNLNKDETKKQVRRSMRGRSI